MTLTPSMTGLIMTVFVLLVGSIGIAGEPTSKQIADFSDATAAKKWLSVNDNVMGGVSEGGLRITDDKTLVFLGNLSLENQGGFASIRTRPADLGLDGYDTISLRFKGDGRTYYIDLRTSGLFAAASYRAALKTQKDTWQELRIPLKDFEYSAFGKRIASAAFLKAGRIQSVGFTLADKKPGSFQLEVAWINGEKNPAIDAPEGSKDIVDTAVASGQFKTLVAAIQAAGLVEALKDKGPLTVFAPTDDAFAKLPKSTVEELLKPENKDKLAALLTYHVVPGNILLGTQSPATLEGQPVAIKTVGTFEINGARISTVDIVCSNGVIHVIDTVLIPPTNKLTPSQASRAVIELAVENGVPLFNAGQTADCVAIYKAAIETLLKSHTDAFDETERSSMQTALNKMHDEKDPRQQAWTLRRALDAAYVSLSRN